MSSNHLLIAACRSAISVTQVDVVITCFTTISPIYPHANMRYQVPLADIYGPEFIAMRRLISPSPPLIFWISVNFSCFVAANMRRYGKCSSLQVLVFFLSIGKVVVAAKNPPPTVPAEPEGVKTITSPSGVKIRYKEPGNDGVCETTPGVNSYSGYVDLNEDSHMFFWLFEARHDPANAPITLFLNGGPGSDSAIGLFQG